jgi:hypothetical protein
MRYHDRKTLNVADVVRYTVTYDPSEDSEKKHRLLSQVIVKGHGHRILHPKIHLRVRNLASRVFRAAYLRGPYVLYVSVRESTFNADIDDDEIPSSSIPIYNHDLKASSSFRAELASDKK